ncbi:MAG: apolipoprotein N-acyltransferase, partial [Burkholderiales bacterium]|nr:apolipoprotein N-acyltransferase [Burkholderiales bacterium]
YIGCVSLIYLKLKGRHTSINFLLLVPSIWVLSEWVRGWLFTGFPWSDISYTQVSTDFLKGYFPVFGSYAVSWLILAIIAGIFIILLEFLNLNRDRSQHKTALRLSILLITIIILVGSLLSDKAYTSKYGLAMSVALVQGNVAQGAKWSSDDFLTIYKGLIAKARADLVIIPETAITTFSEYLPKGYIDQLTRLAQNNGANLIIGIPKIIDKENNYVNSATLLTNSKHPYYAKYHLVPFGEYIPFKKILAGAYTVIALPMVDFSPGEQNQTPLVVGNQKLAFNICYENGFNTELIDNAKNSTVMANISDMVWYGKTIAQDEHLEISQARALENQRYFIQDTNTGATAIINPHGEIQSILPAFTQEILTDQIFGMIGETPFEKVGNYPIIIWCGLIVGCAIILNRRKIK